jgi:Dehydrogenases with different specificities (related to short-chain alcohol dehydrogenases)
MTTNSLPFENKVALVTGSGRGIGRANALRLAEEGADVLVNYVHNQAPAEEVVAQIKGMGRKSIAVRANVGKVEDIGRLFETLAQNFDRFEDIDRNSVV